MSENFQEPIQAGGTLTVELYHPALARLPVQNAVANVNAGEVGRASIAALDVLDIVADALQATFDFFIPVLRRNALD